MKIRYSLPMILIAVAALMLLPADVFAQCAGGGCGGGGKAAAAGGGGCPNGQCPRARAAEAQRQAEAARQAAETAANAISWKSGTPSSDDPVASSTGDTGTAGSDDNAAVEADKIVEIEDAKAAANKLIVVFACTNSEDPRHARFVEACKKFEAEVLRALAVSKELENGTECIRVDIDQCSRKVRNEYGLKRAPEVLIFDATGKRIAKYNGNCGDALAKLIAAAKEKNERVIEKIQAEDNEG